jgi:hypothetical protein
MGGECNQAGGAGGADDAEQADWEQRIAEVVPADLQTAVEQDQQQRDHRDPLDSADRDSVADLR